MDTFPRSGSIMYDIMRGNKDQHSNTMKKFRRANKYFIIPLYRLNILPLFFIGRILLLLYTVGRKSGKTRITPLEYRKREGLLFIFSSRGGYSDWYKNAVSNPDKIKIKIGFRKHSPKLEVLDYSKKLEIMLWYTESFPKASKTLFGYNNKEDKISEELIKPIAEFIEIAQLTTK